MTINITPQTKDCHIVYQIHIGHWPCWYIQLSTNVPTHGTLVHTVVPKMKKKGRRRGRHNRGGRRKRKRGRRIGDVGRGGKGRKGGGRGRGGRKKRKKRKQ